jgi:uncharacterized protein YbdZ (MbtH family)
MVNFKAKVVAPDFPDFQLWPVTCYFITIPAGFEEQAESQKGHCEERGRAS